MPRRAKALPLFTGDTMSSDEYKAYLAGKRSESDVQHTIVRELQRKGWLVVRINGGGGYQKNGQWVWNYQIYGFGNKGLPDLIAYRGGGGVIVDALMIEVKRKGGKLRPSQQQFIERARIFGITVHVADDWEQVTDLIKTL